MNEDTIIAVTVVGIVVFIAFAYICCAYFGVRPEHVEEDDEEYEITA